MSQYAHPGPTPYVQPIKSTDTLPLGTANAPSAPINNLGQATLALSSTYYYPLGGESAPLESVQFTWDAAVILTITIEDTNCRVNTDGNMTYDVSPIDATAGNWIQENPATGVYVATVGAGVTVTNLTIAVAGGAVGGCMIHLGNFGARRLRVKVAVGGTGGVVRCAMHGKM